MKNVVSPHFPNFYIETSLMVISSFLETFTLFLLVFAKLEKKKKKNAFIYFSGLHFSIS